MNFAYLVSFLYILQQALPTALLAQFLLRGKKFERRLGRRPMHTQGISVLVPVKGPLPHLERMLRSVLEQDYAGPIELVLAFQDSHDQELALARSIEAQYADHTSRMVRILTGIAPLGLNLKNSNLEHARRVARFEWYYCADADTHLKRNHLRRALTWAQRYRNRGQESFITAISVHKNPRQMGAILEAVGTNMEFANYFLLSHLSPKTGALNGGSMFFHRDLLKKVGGFTSFLNKITDDLAMQKAFVQAGALSRLLPTLTSVKLEEQSLVGFYQRQLRWQLLVRCFDPVVFYVLAPLNWVGQWLLLCGIVWGDARLLALGAFVLAVRLLRSWLFQIGLGTPFADWGKSLALPIYDLVSPFIWLHTIFVTRVQWAGTSLAVSRDGSLQAISELSVEGAQDANL